MLSTSGVLLLVQRCRTRGILVVESPALESQFTTTSGTHPTWQTLISLNANSWLHAADPSALAFNALSRAQENHFVLGQECTAWSVWDTRGRWSRMEAQMAKDEIPSLVNVLLAVEDRRR